MATRQNVRVGRLTTPELEPFIVANVRPTGRELGAGAYGSVVEVEIPGASVAAKKLHDGLVQFGSAQQVCIRVDSYLRSGLKRRISESQKHVATNKLN